MSHLRSDGTARDVNCRKGEENGYVNDAIREPTVAATEPHAPASRLRVPDIVECGRPRELRRILGIGFDLVSYEDVLAAIGRWRADGERHYLTLTPPYTVLLCHRDPALKQATERAALTLPDGVGIILAARLLRYPHMGRVTGPMLMLKLCDWGRKEGLRHFFCGGLPGVADRLSERLMEKFPGFQVAGTASPPFRSLAAEEDERIVGKINASDADIVWVGLGSPKQEKWMLEHVGRIRAAALIGVGAAFDFHSGHVKWAPAWVRRAGIEWAYRLMKEPRRMWRRNVNSVVFVTEVLHQCLRRSTNGEAAVVRTE